MERRRTAHLNGIRIGLAGRPLDTPIEGVTIDGEVNEDYLISREQEAISIDEAIVSLARAVFSESGTLVFEDSPLLTPLLEEIALEYWQVPELESAKTERVVLSNPQLLVIGHARSHDESWFTPTTGLVTYTAEIPEDFDAIVYVANKAEDFQRWRDRRARRKYVVPSTGGMASEVSSRQGFINFDEELWGDVQRRRTEIPFEYPKERFRQEVPELRYALYPLLMRMIVEDVIGWSRG
jgi:hypothetical protein